MNLFDFFFFLRVFTPSGLPPGETGGRPPELRPSSPPSRWSTGSIATPRTFGRRLRPRPLTLFGFFFFLRVFTPSGRPHGETGGRPPGVRPSSPPSGWSTGFIATPRTFGRRPRQRIAPALPIDRSSWSLLPTWPIV